MELTVAGDEVIDPGRDGGSHDDVVCGVGGYTGERVGDRGQGRLRAEQRQRAVGLLGAEMAREVGLGEDARQLRQDGLRDDEDESAAAPRPEERPGGTGGAPVPGQCL